MGRVELRQRARLRRRGATHTASGCGSNKRRVRPFAAAPERRTRATKRSRCRTDRGLGAGSTEASAAVGSANGRRLDFLGAIPEASRAQTPGLSIQPEALVCDHALRRT